MPGVDGLKTGYVKEGGYGIVVSAKQDNRRLILAINGAETADERKDDARKLLEWGFKNFSEAKLFEPGEIVGHARIWGGERMYMPLVGGDGVSVVLPRVPGQPQDHGAHLLQGPAEAADQEGRSGGHPARHHRQPRPPARCRSMRRRMWAGPDSCAEGLNSLLYLATRWIP